MLRYAILGLLAKKQLHGYDMKNELEKALGGNWEINFGQIYNTLARLERDKCVEVASENKDNRRKKTYAITDTGKSELDQWLRDTVEKPRQLRDEFFIKLVVGKLAGISNVTQMINHQRRSYLQQLRSLNVMAAKTEDLMVSLLIEGAIMHIQADLNWLDICSERLESGQQNNKDHKNK